MPSLFLGRNQLYWCRNCNVPIIDKNTCPACTNTTTLVAISPPYDCRPAFNNDILRIKKLISSQFGENCAKIIEEGKVIVLNKAPYDDRMDEVVIDGKVLGNIRFNVLKTGSKWEFLPKLEGARRMLQYNPRPWIRAHDGAVDPVIKGANLLAPGVVDCSNEIEKGDTVFVYTQKKELIAIGTASFSSQDIPTQKRGMIIKTKYHAPPEPPDILEGGQTWDDVVRINEKILEAKERSVLKYINKVSKKYNLPKLLSFSGGKDSLVLLLLLIKTSLDFTVFFIDTGIEFKETVDFVHQIIEFFNLQEKFLEYKTKNSFYTEARENFGPPARDFRWCCKVLKLSNINDLIRDHFLGGVLTFVGNRKYESFRRRDEARRGKISKNPYIPQQINVNPINNWMALTVWLYIFREQGRLGFEMNPLYELGYERVGCIPCPASKLADLEILRENFPNDYQELSDLLNEHAERNDFPDEWATLGFWRWKKLPKAQLNILKKLNLEPFKAKCVKSQDVQVNYTVGVSPCEDGSVLLEGRVNIGLDLERISNFLSIFGKPMLNSEHGILNIRRNLTLINVFSDGSLSIRSYDGDELTLVSGLKEILPFILKAQRCIGCGICLEMCPSDAIELKEQKTWINADRCDKCFECLKRCPILDYSFKDLLKEI